MPGDPQDLASQFVNALRKYIVVESQSKAMEFPQQQTVAGRQLPEDFLLRGSTLAQNYFPLGFFEDLNPSIKERMEERSDYVVYRAKRIWYLGHELALVSWSATQPSPYLLINSQASRYLEYDHVKQGFSTRTTYAALFQSISIRKSLSHCRLSSIAITPITG